MSLSAVSGLIRRRILVNYNINPEVVGPMLPVRFRPKLAHGRAIAGVCLIRLEQVRPMSLPAVVGLSSENAAHRVAVEWDEAGGTREGVYVWRRDTSSRLNHWAGGRLFAGEHGMADIAVTDTEGRIEYELTCADNLSLRLVGTEYDELPSTSVFADTAEASSFLEGGATGFSPRRKGPGDLDEIRLEIDEWHCSPLRITELRSSFIDDGNRFPVGSICFDSAFVMRDLRHTWRLA